MVSWVHEPMDLEDIIANVSLWWFSGCYPSSIWLYREVRRLQMNLSHLERGDGADWKYAVLCRLDWVFVR